MFLDAHKSWRHVKVTDHRTARDFAECMRDLADIHYPDADRIRVVMDNLSTHTAGALYEAFPASEAHRVLQRLEFHYTPKHASWLNMVEIEIGVLRGQCLDRRIGEREVLVSEIDARLATATQRGWRADQMEIHHAKGTAQAGSCLPGHGQRVVITVQRYFSARTLNQLWRSLPDPDRRRWPDPGYQERGRLIEKDHWRPSGGNTRIPRPIWRNRAGLDQYPAPEIALATLLPAALACCRQELEQRLVTPPSNFLLRIVVEEDQKLVRSLNGRYADAASDVGGLEAAERDALLDVLARHFTGQRWPCSSMEATRHFVVELQTATQWRPDGK